MKLSVPRLILSAAIVAAGIALCAGGLYVGHTDDAPGAGMIGFVLLAASIGVAVWILRRRG